MSLSHLVNCSISSSVKVEMVVKTSSACSMAEFIKFSRVNTRFLEDIEWNER